MMKKILYFFMAAALFCGCKKDEPDPSAFFASLKYADISDAQSLYVTSSGHTTRGDGENETDAPTLYKITFNGETKKVEFVDKSGKPTDVKMNLSDKFLLFNVGISAWDPFGEYFREVDYAFIVRKSDGAMFAPGLIAGADYSMSPLMGFFAMPYGKDPAAVVKDKSWQIQTDDNYDIYFPAGGVAKIYDDAAGNVFVEELVSSEMFSHGSCEGYTVNGNGDVWMLNECDKTSLCRLNSGTFVRGIDYDGQYQSGDIFTLPDHPQSYYQLKGGYPDWSLYKYTAKQDILTEDLIASGMYESSFLTPPSGWGFDVVRLGNCVVVFEGGGIFVVNSETDVRFYDVKFPENKEYMPYLHSAKYVYAPDNQGNIMRFDPTGGTVSPAYSNTRYEIRNVRLFDDDLMQFSAFDLQTGKTVIVEVDNGKERIIDMIDGRTVIQMERIN